MNLTNLCFILFMKVACLTELLHFEIMPSYLLFNLTIKCLITLKYFDFDCEITITLFYVHFL